MTIRSDLKQHPTTHTASEFHQSGSILLVGNWRSDTGYAWKMIERFWISIARAFPDRRTILCFPEIAGMNPDFSESGIEVTEFDFDFRRPVALAQFCRENEVALIYLTDRPYSSLAYPFLRFNGVRKIIVHDHTPGQRTRPSTLKRLAKAGKVRMLGADAYIACSEHVLERLIDVCCIRPQLCHLAENGIDVSQFPQPDPTIRRELSLSPHTSLIVSCSRVHEYKRITDIVDAAALLLDLDIHFIHVGDGPDFGALQSRIREHRLCDRFTLLGRRQDVPAILSGCDIGVHASNGEVGLCLSILEFMASRLPVVVTDEPSVSRIIEPGITGLTYPHGNVQALADRLRLLVGDTHMRHRLGQAARKRIETHHRIESTVSSVVDTLRETLSA